MIFARPFSASTPPLTPDEPTGREWLLNELSKPEYEQARPNFIEVWIDQFWKWFNSLFEPQENSIFAVNPWLIVVLLVIVGIILALIFWGRPRAVAASRAKAGSVFLDDDTRSARELRDAARAAASSGDWALAITEQFRALSRGLTDRTVIAMRPGTTAQGVAHSAAVAFPDHRRKLAQAADLFDGVRYLDRRGDESGYALIRDLDETLERTRPANLPEVATDFAGTGRAR